MARIARVVIEDVPFHVTQRGNGRQQVFRSAQDYELYLDLLQRYATDAEFRILGYCLMPNHVHFIGIPQRAKSMAEAFGRTHNDYARHFNLSQRTCGHVWQARYFSSALDDGHLWNAIAYVERNPVRARLVERAEEFRWSSAAGRLRSSSATVTARPGLLNTSAWAQRFSAEQWREVLVTSLEEEAFGRRLHEASRRGRPLGDEEFVKELERRSGRRLTPKAVGRPKTSQKVAGIQLALEYGI